MQCKVVRVMPWAESQGAFVEINESDYDPAKHKLYVEPDSVLQIVKDRLKLEDVEQASVDKVDPGQDPDDAVDRGAPQSPDEVVKKISRRKSQ